MGLLTHRAWQEWHSTQSVKGETITLWVNQSHPNLPWHHLDALILGVFHGDEPESFDLAQSFFEAFQSQFSSSARVGLVKAVNPDGLMLNQRTNANGVDLNRNFATQNWEPIGENTPYYCGVRPFSEPETRFLKTIIEQYSPKVIVTLHTPYRVINFDGPAKSFADSMAHYNGYEVVEDIGYPTPGSFGTYYGKERHIPVITLELPEKEDYTETERENNIQALFAIIQQSVL